MYKQNLCQIDKPLKTLKNIGKTTLIQGKKRGNITAGGCHCRRMGPLSDAWDRPEKLP
jgi:hypothetical protein